MTPTPAASHVDQSSSLALRHSPGDVLAGALVLLLDPIGWRRLRLLVDIVVLYLASSAALFADPTITRRCRRPLAGSDLPVDRAGVPPRRQRPGRPPERLIGRRDRARARSRFARGDADDRSRRDRWWPTSGGDRAPPVAVRRGLPGGGSSRAAIGPPAGGPDQGTGYADADRGRGRRRRAPRQAPGRRAELRPLSGWVPRR